MASDEAAAIEFRRETSDSAAARRLIGALDAELSALYPEAGTARHFRLAAAEVSGRQGVFLVAYAGGKPVACGAVRRLDAHTAEIKRLYVAPARRGSGLGRRLLAALEAAARALGARRILLETGPRQPAAIALYARAGYTETAAFGEYEPSPLSTFMAKDL
jgi:GNAT superfamily N-acetyltransferase